MGTNRTPDNVRGFIVPWQMDKSNYWADQSSATQGVQRAGIPDAQTPTSLVLSTRGVQSEIVQVKTIEGGHISEGAKFGWKYDPDTNYYGHNVPNVLTGVQAIAKLSLVNQQYITRSAITTNDGTVICAVEYTTVTNNNVRVYRIDPDGTVSFTSINTVAISTLGGQKRYPALINLANGYVLCVFYAIDTTSSVANIVVYQSTNNGQTWDLISKRALQTPIPLTGTLGKISGAATASQTLLFLETIETTANNRNLGYQYASVSQGAKFQFVGKSDPAQTTYRMHEIDVVQYNGVFVISFIRNNDTIGVTQITDAFDNIFNTLVFTNITEITGVDYAQFITDALQDGDKSMHMDTDGRIYIYARLRVNYMLACAYSDCMGIEAVDYGRTWHFMGPNPAVVTPEMQHAQVYEGGSAGDVQNIATTYYNGQQLVLCNWRALGTNAYQYSVMALRFGMWATQINPRLVGYPTDSQWAHNTFDWAPCDLPTQGSQWLLSTSGGPTLALNADRLNTTCTGVQTYQYRKTITTKTNGVTMHVALDGVSGGGASQGTYIGIQIQQPASATTGYYIRVYMTATSLYLVDMYGSTLDSATGLVLDGYAIYAYLNNSTGDINVFYANIDGPRQYGVLSGRCTAAATAVNQYTWGATSTTVSKTANWAYVSVSEGSEMGVGVDSTLNGKQYPGVGFYAGIDAGLYLSTQDGPARETDQWEIVPQYDTPTERVLYPLYPSRGVTWRSDAVANPDTTNVPQNELAWMLDPNNVGVDVRSPNSVIGIHLNNINFRSMAVYKYIGGVWTLHANVINQVGAEFEYVRRGNTVYVTSTNTDRPWLHYNECAGWFLVLIDVDTDEQIVRKIVTNSEGVLDSSTTTKTVVFTIEGAKSTDPTSGEVARIVPNACTILLHGITDLAGLKLRINTQKTTAGYFEIGHMVMGPVVIPATQYGRGRTINWEANTDTTTLPNGTQYANTLGNGGRTVRIAWVDGVDITELYQYTPNPDYYTTKPGGLPEAAIGSAPTTVYGIVQHIQGERNAVVYLPTIDTTATQTYDMINRYHDHVMVTLGNDVQIENVIGDESKNEVLRVGTVVMREVR